MAVADLIEATRAGVPDGVLRPRNCHEAALGWLILSIFAQYRLAGPQTGGVARAWRAVRNISDAHGAAPNPQLTGPWVGANLYAGGGVRVTVANRAMAFAQGQSVAMGAPAAPHHSMIIESVVGGQALARGFNNAGGFGGQQAFLWDPILRDLADPNRWDGNDNFMCINGPAAIYVFPYATMVGVVTGIATANAGCFSD